jgi:hypothetical protein
MLYFTQAFDMIAHDLMVCKMSGSQRYSDGATSLLGSYLSDRTQYVRSNGEYSMVRGIEYGVTIFCMSEKRNCMPEKRFCMPKKNVCMPKFFHIISIFCSFNKNNKPFCELIINFGMQNFFLGMQIFF